MEFEQKRQAIIVLSDKEQNILDEASGILSEVLDNMRKNQNDNYGSYLFSFDDLNKAYRVLLDFSCHIISDIER